MNYVRFEELSAFSKVSNKDCYLAAPELNINYIIRCTCSIPHLIVTYDINRAIGYNIKLAISALQSGLTFQNCQLGWLSLGQGGGWSTPSPSIPTATGWLSTPCKQPRLLRTGRAYTTVHGPQGSTHGTVHSTRKSKQRNPHASPSCNLHHSTARPTSPSPYFSPSHIIFTSSLLVSSSATSW
jgi:hypothetical protein